MKVGSVAGQKEEVNGMKTAAHSLVLKEEAVEEGAKGLPNSKVLEAE